MKLSNKWKIRLTRVMQSILAVLFVAGFYYGSSKVVINSGIGLAISFIPSIMERKYNVVADPLLTLWITAAIFFHSMGSLRLYNAIPWWDHLTHSLSASILAGVGYTFIRSVDIHSEEIYLPHKFMFVFLLLTIMAFGVVWEIFEYGLDIIADSTGLAMPLAQHGLEDSMKDMMFNTLGAVITAVFGQVYLSELAEKWAGRHLHLPNKKQ